MYTNRLLAAATVVVSLSLTACGGDDAEPVLAVDETQDEAAPAADADADAADALDAADVEPGLVSPETAAALSQVDGITVIDVRTPEEFAEGHIEGATLIDFYDESFAEQIAALDPDGEYLLYCRSGNRSGQAFGLMDQLGFDRVWDLDGGVLAYGAAGLPLTD